METISWIGNQPQIFLLITFFIFALWFLKLRKEAFVLAINGVGIYFLGNLIKIIVQTPRPPFSLLHDWSFPSGHVMSFVACFGFLAYLIYKLPAHYFFRKIFFIILIGLIILIGPSRIYLGDHWISDVLGGYLIGGAWLFLMIKLYLYSNYAQSTY
jgi:undecaprenyl-diphosphatase